MGLCRVQWALSACVLLAGRTARAGVVPKVMGACPASGASAR